jgi:hypothetical protein
VKYKVLSHTHEMTGGYCTASIFRLQDVTNGKLRYLMIDDNGGALATKDFILQDVDDVYEVLIDTFEFDTLNASHENFELYRYCYNEFVKEDCRYFKSTKWLPYRLLSGSLRAQISIGYYRWHKQNVGDCFETDGYRIIFADGYNK